MPLRSVAFFSFPSPKPAEGNEGNGGGSNNPITPVTLLVSAGVDLAGGVHLPPRVVVNVVNARSNHLHLPPVGKRVQPIQLVVVVTSLPFLREVDLRVAGVAKDDR